MGRSIASSSREVFAPARFSVFVSNIRIKRNRNRSPEKDKKKKQKVDEAHNRSLKKNKKDETIETIRTIEPVGLVRTPEEDLDSSDEEMVLRYHRHYVLKDSLAVLEYFNRGMEALGGVTYELVEALDKNDIYQVDLWSHLSFKAKPKNAPPESEAVLFFGETLGGMDGMTFRCCIVNPDDSRGYCYECGLVMVHPPDGFNPKLGLKDVVKCHVETTYESE